MLPTERIDYVPIAGRKKLHLPDGKRLIVWVIVNVEEWNARETMPRTVLTPPAGGSPTPDIPNWGVARIRQSRRILAHAGCLRRS